MVGRPALFLLVLLVAPACGGESTDAASKADSGAKVDSTSGDVAIDAGDTRPTSLDGSDDTASLFDVEGDEVKSDACVTASCDVTSGPGTYCTFAVSIKPYVSRLGGGFQSISGTGAQTTIVVRFSKPVESVTVTAVDPDYVGNRMQALDAVGKAIATVSFDGDGKPGVVSMSTKTVTAKGIVRVDLIPAVADFVWYQKLSFSYCP